MPQNISTLFSDGGGGVVIKPQVYDFDCLTTKCQRFLPHIVQTVLQMSDRMPVLKSRKILNVSASVPPWFFIRSEHKTLQQNVTPNWMWCVSDAIWWSCDNAHDYCMCVVTGQLGFICMWAPCSLVTSQNLHCHVIHILHTDAREHARTCARNNARFCSQTCLCAQLNNIGMATSSRI